jgi:hypothetical protein
MNKFKEKQITRVIESIGKAASFKEANLETFIKKYTDYEDYEMAIKDLIYESYETFYANNKAVWDYSFDMIRNISFNLFSSKLDMISYVTNRKEEELVSD